MFSGHTKIDRKKIEQTLIERAQALGLEPGALEADVGGAPLRELLCALIEETLSQTEAESREALRQRQQAGREAAQKRGVALGRPTKLRSEKRFAKVHAAYEAHEITAEEAAQRLHISVSTFYRWLREARNEEK